MSANPEVAGVSPATVSRLPKRRLTRSPRLGPEFDPRRNALNAWRLMLASGVILNHSWPLTGRRLAFLPAERLIGDVWVDGFFAVSGFLITWSWFRNPRLRDYFAARGLRILPALWACLAVTAFVIAPIALAIQGGPAVKLLLSREPIEYVLKNCAVVVLQGDVGGTPTGVPVPRMWDGPLWTLAFEVMCYIAIAVLGVVGLLRRRWLIPVALALALYWSALLPPPSGIVGQRAVTGQQIDVATAALLVEGETARFAVMFLTGALLYQFRNVIPARWSLVALSIVIVLAGSLLPNYRLVAAIPLAYAIIVSGTLIHHKRLSLRTDLSYGVYIYAFPMQQVLVICGLASLNVFVFTVAAFIATVPLAAASWFAVEKPAISLKSRLRRTRVAPATEIQPGHAT